MTVVLDGNHLNLDEFIQVVRFKKSVELSEDAIGKIKKSRTIIDKIVDQEKVVYGVNTGFGKLANVVISKDEVSQLQENLLKSHACGVGNYFDKEVTRGIMLLRVNALAKGYSGIRLETLERLMFYLNEDILPLIPEKGSLGASGDLAPLSHMALSLIGLGKVLCKDKQVEVSEVLKTYGMKPLDKLLAKEGLSLINGTQAMTSVGAITTYDAIQLSKLADIAGSLSMEALFGIRDAMNEKVHLVRGQIGQINSAKNILSLTANSQYITSQGDIRVQDAYSIRCMPQVHGASKDALKYIKEKVEIEMNAATDNPLVFDENTVISGGNFHGQPMALSFDFLKIAISELANISERRLERLVNPSLSEGLPAFLVKKSGVNSGFMITQYSAASLVSENKVLAHPASVDSIPSSANQEDHVSMGTIAARGAKEILYNAQSVLAIELLASAQAIDFREKKKLGLGTQVAYAVIRKHVDFIDEDVIMHPYIIKMHQLVKDELILNQVEKVVGSLL
ncbi:histidine ammonia-lyase [Mycoplasmatota bacterium]|nr:histidine ammonia-lyase [Mycoplasmatota bacterium]